MPNRTVPFIEVPHAILPAKTPTDAIRALVATALSENLPLEANNADGVDRKTIFMPPVLDLKIERLAQKHEWTYQNTIASLVTAALVVLSKRRGKVEAAKADVSIPFAARPGQDVFYRSIMASIEANRVCLAEASTGIGKSRSMVAAAIVSAMSGKRPVVIAAPTLAILGGSLWMEFEQLYSGGLGPTVKARYYPGAGEFVDCVRLKAFMNEAAMIEEGVDKAVMQWVAAGGPNLLETPLSRAMKKGGRPLCWLMSDLRSLASQIDPEEFALKKVDENEEVRALISELRADAVTADIIFCTHAMLATAQRSEWKWFPSPAVLMIDEAHLFEGILSDIYSSRLSINSLRHNTRVMRKASGLGPASASGKLESVLSDLIGVLKRADDGTGSGVKLYAGDPSLEGIQSVLGKLALALTSKTLSKLSKIGEARSVVSSAQSALTGGINAYGRIEFSPDRRFPAILVGKRSSAATLGHLWSQVQGGVILASASLSTPDEFGNSKFDYVAGLLALPASRLDSPNPVVAPWTRSIPTLYTPKFPEELSRPLSATRTPEKETAWLSRVAAQTALVADRSKGGTMVLLSSYAQIREVHAHLVSGAAGGLGHRLIAQSPDEKFAACEARFRAAYAHGDRPVLLAVGVAWTGVDLTDKSAPEGADHLLSDLIIGCLPIGLNRSSTMAARTESQGIYPLVKEALMTLLQGIGRAVRTEKAVDKNIWILDGRIWSAWPGMKSFQQSARRILEKYPKRVEF